MFSREAKLHPEITKAVQDGKPIADMVSYYAPDEAFIKVITAASLLRKGQHQTVKPLANKPLPQLENESTVDRLFRTIVNQSLDKTSREQGLPSRLRTKSESICSSSEVQFGMLINDMYSGLEPGVTAGRLVTNQEGPLFLQKHTGEPTFLSLQDTTIAGIGYPAGSIMGVHLERDKQQDTGRYERPSLPEDSSFEVIDASEIEGANFLRPSLLALTPDERASYLSRPECWGFHWSNHPQALQTIAHISVAQVAEIAHNSSL